MGQTCSACVPTEYLPRPGLLTPKPPSPQLLSSGAAAASVPAPAPPPVQPWPDGGSGGSSGGGAAGGGPAGMPPSTSIATPGSSPGLRQRPAPAAAPAVVAVPSSSTTATTTPPPPPLPPPSVGPLAGPQPARRQRESLPLVAPLPVAGAGGPDWGVGGRGSERAATTPPHPIPQPWQPPVERPSGRARAADGGSSSGGGGLLSSTPPPPIIPDASTVYKLTGDGEGEEDVCPTCLEGYSASNPRMQPRCGHEFHLACIYEWLERSPYCPVCARRMVFEEWS